MSSHRREIARLANIGRIVEDKKSGVLSFEMALYLKKEPRKFVAYYQARHAPLDFLQAWISVCNERYMEEMAWEARTPNLPNVSNMYAHALDLLYKELARRAEKVQSKTHE